jgi:catechol 2,3-dioxygenase-like lactoylglutathione lyase family enzyme
MDDALDDWFELALDLPPPQRADLLARLRADDPTMARRLEALLPGESSNADFNCRLATQTHERPPDHIEHITLAVDDVRRTATWYQDVLRCRVRHVGTDRAVLAFANVEVHLVDGSRRPQGLGVRCGDLSAFGSLGRSCVPGQTLHVVDPAGNALELQKHAPLPEHGAHDGRRDDSLQKRFHE